MTRRIVRTGIQLGLLFTTIVLILVFFDNHFRVLPQSIHNHLPVHHPGLIITDIHVQTCSSLNPLSSCKLDPDKWHRIEKDLYLGSGWFNKAYVHVKRKREEELNQDDRVVLDVRVGRLDPSMGEKGQETAKWESRPAGVWLLRSSKRHDSDSDKVITAIDILFGADAVEPRPGWEVRDTPMLLDTSGEAQEARISVRRGVPHKTDKPVPRIKKDGKFKILQVSDLHLSTGLGACRDPEPKDHNGGQCDADSRTLDFVGKILDEEKPDMVVLSGDQVNGDTAPDAQSAIFKFAELFIKRKIPYAAIFGNHDDEGSLSRAAQMSLLTTLPYSLSEPGPNTIEGVGNYYVEIMAPGNSQHSAMTLYFLDTHAYSPDEAKFRGYDWLKPNQITWFKDTAHSLKDAHKQYTHIHLDMAFIHIPLPEYALKENSIVGTWKEGVTAPGFNSHFFDALVENHVLAVSCGHDHVNDYCALGKVDEDPKLWMCYAGGSGFGGYGGYDGYHRRVRVFDVDMNKARITTWKRVEYGDTKAKLDEQIIVEGGQVFKSA
ncbi:calcineurin-like phosphoesterase [Diplodia corticola]|uniref:Calcineurin-like phosphoesterase n=1 Tax=Diplodia corticola TaxID=236234 RepID=A0A1J9SBI0_9PEZI|nr:calcineurin-like phosphoesterase [Diplodia corticola]OJD36941.1 calcineurin-like phosphoesterase [Diplodia corticola]